MYADATPSSGKAVTVQLHRRARRVAAPPLGGGVQSNSSMVSTAAQHPTGGAPLQPGQIESLARARSVCNRPSLLWCRSNAAVAEASSRAVEGATEANRDFSRQQYDLVMVTTIRPFVPPPPTSNTSVRWPEADKSPSTASHSK